MVDRKWSAAAPLLDPDLPLENGVLVVGEDHLPAATVEARPDHQVHPDPILVPEVGLVEESSMQKKNPVYRRKREIILCRLFMKFAVE